MNYYKGNLRLIEGMDGNILNDRIVDRDVVVYSNFARVYCYALSGNVVSRKEDAQGYVYSSSGFSSAIYFDLFHMESISSLEAANLVLRNYWAEFTSVSSKDASKVLKKIIQA